MSKNKNQIRSTFAELIIKHKSKLIYFGILCVISIVFYLFLYFTRERSLLGQTDNSFIVCFAYFLIGCLSIINNLGFFDLITYGFKNGLSYLKNNKRAYEDAYSYKQTLVEKRKNNRANFLLYFAISFIYLIVFMVFYIQLINL